MSDLHELIAALRAHDTEFKALDEVGSLYGGLTGKSKADFADGNARFVTYVNVFQNRATNVSPDDTVRIGEGERQNRVRYGDVLFTASSEGGGRTPGWNWILTLPSTCSDRPKSGARSSEPRTE